MKGIEKFIEVQNRINFIRPVVEQLEKLGTIDASIEESIKLEKADKDAIENGYKKFREAYKEYFSKKIGQNGQAGLVMFHPIMESIVNIFINPSNDNKAQSEMILKIIIDKSYSCDNNTQIRMCEIGREIFSPTSVAQYSSELLKIKNNFLKEVSKISGLWHKENMNLNDILNYIDDSKARVSKIKMEERSDLKKLKSQIAEDTKNYDLQKLNEELRKLEVIRDKFLAQKEEEEKKIKKLLEDCTIEEVAPNIEEVAPNKDQNFDNKPYVPNFFGQKNQNNQNEFFGNQGFQQNPDRKLLQASIGFKGLLVYNNEGYEIAVPKKLVNEHVEKEVQEKKPDWDIVKYLDSQNPGLNEFVQDEDYRVHQINRVN